MKVVGYIRVSTVGQATEGVSLEAQRARIDAWCAMSGTAVEDGDVHVDAGLSGKRADNRPALQAALKAVCEASGVLVVYSLSRLARSVRDTLEIAERLKTSGAHLVSLSEDINTTSAAGKMIFRLLAVLAEFERDLISERTRGAVAHLRSLNQRTGQVPYGQVLAQDGRTLLRDRVEENIVAEVRRWRSEGRSLRQIAGSLTLLGIPTKNGGSVWSHSTVADLLKRKPTHEESKASEAAIGETGPVQPTA